MSDLQHQRLTELSRELRLSAIPDLYSAIAQSAAAKAASFADFLEEILRAERDARRARAREMFARVAGFPTVKTLDGFDFGFANRCSAPADPGARRARLHRARREHRLTALQRQAVKLEVRYYTHALCDCARA